MRFCFWNSSFSLIYRKYWHTHSRTHTPSSHFMRTTLIVLFRAIFCFATKKLIFLFFANRFIRGHGFTLVGAAWSGFHHKYHLFIAVVASKVRKNNAQATNRGIVTTNLIALHTYLLTYSTANTTNCVWNEKKMRAKKHNNNNDQVQVKPSGLTFKLKIMEITISIWISVQING